jgi:hypothetical protein
MRTIKTYSKRAPFYNALLTTSPEIVQFSWGFGSVSPSAESLLERVWNLQKTQAITPLAGVAGLDKNILTGNHNI